ncbi:hypothetical protein MPSEU_000048900 [Mayamaea pseudoterrestris]|nr:hypothetical protein MPSEU_000048900 [Mayamaea pseudoterrestris]
MGNFTSSPEQQKARKLKKELEKRKKDMETRGVLVPPSFLLNESLSIQNRLPLQPSLFDELYAHDASNRLFLDYMRPGLWISAQDSLHGTRVAASVPFDSKSNPNLNASTYLSSLTGTSSLFLMERVGGNNTLQLRVGNDLQPTVSASYSLLKNNKCTLFGHVKPNGYGWTGTHMEYTLREDENQPTKSMQLSLGTYVKGHVTMPQQQPYKSPVHTAPLVADQVTAYAAAQFLGITAAVETQVPLHHRHPDLSNVLTRSYVTMNVAGEGPPLQVSLSKTPLNQSLSISQEIPFDRYQFNPSEDRAPKVRNSFAWTIKLEQSQSQVAGEAEAVAAASTIINTTSSLPSSSPRLSIGAAWQINRAVGVKTVMDDSGCTMALVLRRWSQPRLACSLILQHDAMMGVALELESGHLRSVNYISEHDQVVGGGADSVAETRTTIPMMET